MTVWSDVEFVLANEICKSHLYDGKLYHVSHFVLNAALIQLLLL